MTTATVKKIQLPEQPDWMAALREESETASRELPFPTSQWEAWRRTSPEKFHPGELEWTPVQTEVSAPQGVVAVDLAAGLHSQPGLIQKDFLAAAPKDDVFVRMNAAFWSNGGLVQLPANQRVDQPVRVINRVKGSGVAFPHTLIRAGKFSEGAVVESFESSEDELLAIPVIEIQVEDGARLDYVVVHKWGARTRYLPIVRARVQRDAYLRVLFVGLGGSMGKNFMQGDLDGAGSKSEMLGLIFGRGKQHLDSDVHHNHNVANTTSDVLFHVALIDRARSIFAGNIAVEPGAQKTDAYQANRNLLLSDKARADAMPKLEIGANDVRCTHGATFATYDKDQQFYLRSRGLSRSEAEHLLVTGFYQEVYGRLDRPDLVEWLGQEMEQALSRALEGATAPPRTPPPAVG